MDLKIFLKGEKNMEGIEFIELILFTKHCAKFLKCDSKRKRHQPYSHGVYCLGKDMLMQILVNL